MTTTPQLVQVERQLLEFTTEYWRAVALGSLLIYLLHRSLPNQECRLRWKRVECWLGEVVEAKHPHPGVA